MDAEEADLLAATRRFTHGRDVDRVVALLRDDLDNILQGRRSRAFTGIAFDAYCRSLLASRGHDGAIRDEVESLCNRSRGSFGHQPWTHLYDGCLFHLGGNGSAAALSYALAAKDVEVLWPSSVGCRSVMSPVQCAGFLQETPLLTQVNWQKEATAADFVLFAACDSGYLRLFAPTYLRSISRHGGMGAVHLHIVNPAQDDLTWLEREAADLWPQIAISTELYSGPDQRAYFALARMLRLALLLEAYHRPILVTDIDAAFTYSIDDISLLRAPAPVGLRFKQSDYHAHPWNTFPAGAVLILPTEQGLEFAKAVAAISAGLFRERAGSGIWFIDQNVLFSAYQHYSQEAGLFFDINRTLPGGLTFGKTLCSL